MEAEAVNLLAKEREKIQVALVALQQQKKDQKEPEQLRKKVAKLCRTAKKDGETDLLAEIIESLEQLQNMGDQAELDKKIMEHTQLLQAFDLVLSHYGYVAPKFRPTKLLVRAETPSPEFESVVPKQISGGSRSKERLEILRRIVLSLTKDNQAPLDQVFAEFKNSVSLPAGFNHSHLGLCLNKLGYSWSRIKNSIFPLQPKVNRTPKILRNYRDKALAVWLSLGASNHLGVEQIREEAIRLGLVQDKYDWERFSMYLFKHAQDTLLENRLFALVKEPEGKGRKAVGGIFNLTSLGKKLLADHETQLAALPGAQPESKTEQGED